MIELFLMGQLLGSISNEPGLIGVKTGYQRRIERVHHGSPAEKAGLLVGDVIVAVDGEVKKEIRGMAGELCTLTIRRKRPYGDLTFTVVVEKVSARKIKDLEHKYYTLAD